MGCGSSTLQESRLRHHADPPTTSKFLESPSRASVQHVLVSPSDQVVRSPLCRSSRGTFTVGLNVSPTAKDGKRKRQLCDRETAEGETKPAPKDPIVVTEAKGAEAASDLPNAASTTKTKKATPFQRPDLYLLELTPSMEQRQLEEQWHQQLKKTVWSLSDDLDAEASNSVSSWIHADQDPSQSHLSNGR